ncbi:hypothetical protein NUW58_g2317 [Xylaria curta]|uniref:Uncharacterized protein n=1 Tax=Xylaria curta TaxID=42375 RepID=A0ACC1PJ04_9PEZI|nr:hypothetical protein NUW58_g2317 [Xylaria curta]
MMSDENLPTLNPSLAFSAEALHHTRTAASVPSKVISINNPKSPQDHGSAATADTRLTFANLPLEIREIIWRFALPEARNFNVLVWVSAGLKMQLLNRSELKLPLAHACFEARRVVKESGYVLAFRDEDNPDDPGVWFHPRKDRIERTIWGPGDWSM